MRNTLIHAFIRKFIEKMLFVPGTVLGAEKELAGKTLFLSSGSAQIRKEEISMYEIMIIILIILVIKFPGMDGSFCWAGTFRNITDKTYLGSWLT